MLCLNEVIYKGKFINVSLSRRSS